MERNRGELVRRAADLFDLPADVISSLPAVELIGDCQMLMDSHQGILSYSREAIDINGGSLVVRVTGFTAYFCLLTPEFRKLVVDRILLAS